MEAARFLNVEAEALKVLILLFIVEISLLTDSIWLLTFSMEVSIVVVQLSTRPVQMPAVLLYVRQYVT